MSRDKQIEEMAIMMGVPACQETGCINCAVDYNCIWRNHATLLYNAGYRKSEDVAEEIFAEIDKLISKRGDLLMLSNGYYLKLKKKYTEGCDG